jgi:hypothetical protein
MVSLTHAVTDARLHVEGSLVVIERFAITVHKDDAVFIS